MNRLSRAGIAVALSASMLWSGGVAEAGRLAVDESVCVNASSGVVSLVTYNTRFCSKQNWSDSKPAPPLCWLDSSTVRQDLRRSISIAPASGCILPFRSVPAGEVLLLCADGLSGLLRWPVTGACFSYNWKTWVRSASAPNPASPPTDFTTTSTTSTTAVVVPSVSLSTTWIQSITFPKAVTVTANVAGTIYFAEGAFVVKTVSDITSAPSYRWAKGTVASANTPTSIAIDVDALTNGYYRVYVANSQGVLSAPATNIVTISVPRTPTAAEIAAEKAAADKKIADEKAAADKVIADKAAADKVIAEKAAAAAKAAAAKKTTITCVKGKLTKKVTAVKPVCPSGYKKK